MDPKQVDIMLAELFDQEGEIINQLWEDWDFVRQCRRRGVYKHKDMQLTLVQIETGRALLASIHGRIEYLRARFLSGTVSAQRPQQQSPLRPPEPLQRNEPMQRRMVG